MWAREGSGTVRLGQSTGGRRLRWAGHQQVSCTPQLRIRELQRVARFLEPTLFEARTPGLQDLHRRGQTPGDRANPRGELASVLGEEAASRDARSPTIVRSVLHSEVRLNNDTQASPCTGILLRNR